MRTIALAGVAALLGACATVSGGDSRQTEARALAQQYAEELVDDSLATLSQMGVLGDIDCSQETGQDAKQCAAFSTLMASRLETLQSKERESTLEDTADEIDALTVALTKLSDGDFSVLQANAKLPAASILTIPISVEGQDMIREPQAALLESLAASDQQTVDKVQALVVEVLAELMADPILQ